MTEAQAADIFSVSDSNYFARPVAPSTPVQLWDGASYPDRSLAYWQTITGADANSWGSPITLEDSTKFMFVYNETKSDSTFTFAEDLITIDSALFTGDTVISAFRSAVFFVDPNPAGEYNLPTVINDSIDYVWRKKCTVYATISGDDIGTISERGFVYNTSIDPKITDSKVVVAGTTGSMSAVLRNFEPSTTYYVRPFATNEIGTAYGDDQWEITTPEFVVLKHQGKSLVMWIDTTTPPELPDFCDEYQAVYDVFLVKPGIDTAMAQNAMTDSLVSQGYWARMDFLHIQANNTAANAYINWLNPGTFDLTDPGSTDPAFTTYEGTTGDGNDYLDTDYKLSEDTINVTRISNTIICYIRNETGWSSAYALGTKTSNRYHGLRPIVQDKQQSVLNALGFQNYETGNSSGIHIVTRIAHDVTAGYRNGILLGTDTYVSYPLTDLVQNILIHAVNNDGTPDYLSIFQISIEAIMDGVDQDDVTGLTTIFETYMDAIGKGVIE